MMYQLPPTSSVSKLVIKQSGQRHSNRSSKTVHEEKIELKSDTTIEESYVTSWNILNGCTKDQDIV